DTFATRENWSTCPISVACLLRLLLTEQFVGRQVSGSEALGQLEAIRRVQGWSFLTDSVSLAEPVIDTRVLMGRRQVTDLQLVNVAAANDTKVATFDAALRTSLMRSEEHTS